ncbi:unnamed protein product [Lactuca virosa]|uniref:ARID domain-containing protein n=1 Tax=Lactuca virosa TaxID=75947 RepID=A0AAU9LEQ8_9ASTR|nr:unnamed protein product [Lactuca virosa]
MQNILSSKKKERGLKRRKDTKTRPLYAAQKTGWSKLADGCALDCFRTLEEIHKIGVSIKCGEFDTKFTKSFNQIVSRFSKEICQNNCFTPFPPMLGDGKPIDLLTLYLCVREKGGYESVSRYGIWDLVAKEIGFNSNDSAYLKVVYLKYLESLEQWFCKIVKDKDSVKNSDMNFDPRKFFLDVEMKDYNEFVDTNVKKESEVIDLENIVERFDVEENESSKKRKRERYLPLLDWVKRVAKDPCDPAIGIIPERNKWKAYGGEHVWKQVLSAREARLLQLDLDSKAKVIWQKKNHMHPAMYEDRTEKSTSRFSQRLITAKETQSIHPSRKPPTQDSPESSSGSPSDRDRDEEHSFYGCNLRRKRTPLGRSFQAKLPELPEPDYSPDPKWLGTQIWPLQKGETRSSLLELDRIGKGRQDSCGCQFQGSLECVKFHISEKRNRGKLELGSAFYKWKFNEMGENVAISWTRDEEKKFEEIIKSTPSSTGRSFWDELRRNFKNKSMRAMVSYYFNVYLLRRRAHQNRSDPNNIDSDDDEFEKIENEANKNDTGSILCSPKKVHLNAR